MEAGRLQPEEEYAMHPTWRTPGQIAHLLSVCHYSYTDASNLAVHGWWLHEDDKGHILRIVYAAVYADALTLEGTRTNG